VSGNVRVVTITDGKPMLDLAIDSAAVAAKDEGQVASGNYVYEVVWQTESGTKYGVEVEADTASMTDFQGAIQLNNLPATTGEKLIYRTDRTGEGDRKLVGALQQGASTTFVDRFSDDQRTGDPITERVNLVEFANKVTVPLSSVGEIRPPSN
jgi:flagellar basal-body rod modification protein FlgD